MEKEVRLKTMEIYNKLDDIGWEISEAMKEVDNLQEIIKNKNSIKDVDNLKRELKRDGLYSEKLEEFLEDYMRYYNK